MPTVERMSAARLTLSARDRELLYEAVYDLMAREPRNPGIRLLRAAANQLLIGRELSAGERHACRLAAAAYTARTPHETDAARLVELLDAAWD